MLVSLLTYAVFGQNPKYAERLPDPADLAAKTKAMMKPVTTERKPSMKDKLKKFWNDHEDVALVVGSTALITAGTVIVATVTSVYVTNKTIDAAVRNAANTDQ